MLIYPSVHNPAETDERVHILSRNTSNQSPDTCDGQKLPSLSTTCLLSSKVSPNATDSTYHHRIVLHVASITAMDLDVIV